ncbi:MAG: tetratricopeptide repeat protein [Bryobacteraceae bacterium]
MKHFIPTLFFLLSIPGVAPAQKTGDIVKEISRDLATMEQEVKQSRTSVERQLAELKTLVQQSIDNSRQANTSVAVLDSGIRDRINEQMKSLIGPVAGLSGKLDQMTSEFQSVRNSMDDLTSRMKRLEAQVGDLSNTLKVMQAPPAPPASPLGGGAAGSGPPPPAEQLYQNALRDRSGGNLDLSMQGFSEYLKYYDKTDLASNAQFYIGMNYYDKGDFPAAVTSFDTVVEKYGETTKSPDATYMKGMALLKAGQRNEAGKEFLNVIQKYPKSEVAPKAREQRKALGLSVPSAQAAPRKKRR